MSFPVAGTIMIEPTESEDKPELDRFCDALISIHDEIMAIEKGLSDKLDNPLKNAPHTQKVICADEWKHAYTRQEAPSHYIMYNKINSGLQWQESTIRMAIEIWFVLASQSLLMLN